MQKTFGWLGVLGIICIGGVALWRQHQTQKQLHRQVGELRQQSADLPRQREENQRLVATLPAAERAELARGLARSGPGGRRQGPGRDRP